MSNNFAYEIFSVKKKIDEARRRVKIIIKVMKLK